MLMTLILFMWRGGRYVASLIMLCDWEEEGGSSTPPIPPKD